MILTMDAWGHSNMSTSETAAKKAYDVVFKDMAEMNADLERVHKSSNSPLHALCSAVLCCAPLPFQSGVSQEIFAESAATSTWIDWNCLLFRPDPLETPKLDN